CFFFFQAEDGIRDLIVTGVQTCALPICLPAGPRLAALGGGALLALLLLALALLLPAGGVPVAPSHAASSLDRPRKISRTAAAPRSEERRVGKECGWRGGRERCKE